MKKSKYTEAASTNVLFNAKFTAVKLRDALGCQSHHVLSTRELWYSEWCRHGVTPKKDKF